MSILGDIIEVHHRRFHPRLGTVDDTHAIAIISDLLAKCEASIDKVRRQLDGLADLRPALSMPGAVPIKDLISGYNNAVPPPSPPAPATAAAAAAASQPSPAAASSSCQRARLRSRLQLVTAYSAHILHVLHVLLHGKWDAISMLDDDDDWITSTRFNDCATHAIAAGQAVNSILKFDPELTFMPYLFGIYLLHGSFILLLFADRMPQLGANQSVELACETIVRAHEVCVVTLSTEFQVCPPRRIILGTLDVPMRALLLCSGGHVQVRLTGTGPEKLPEGSEVDAVQCAGLKPDGVGGAQCETESTVAVSMDQRRQRPGIVKSVRFMVWSTYSLTETCGFIFGRSCVSVVCAKIGGCWWACFTGLIRTK